MLPSHPILSCEEARTLEQGLFAGDEAAEWAAMLRAGAAVAEAARRDFDEIGGFPENGRVLVLAGKGHNGGDALLAARHLLARYPRATAEVVFVFGERALRPLAWRAWQYAQETGRERWTQREPSTAGEWAGKGYDLGFDGIFGFQFRPPVEPPVAELIERVNAAPIRLRAAVDLPSGGLLRADFTYATGAVKTPILTDANAGRLRYLDLGFFPREAPGAQRVLTPAVLAPLAALRPAHCDKRDFGHLFVIGGSHNYPGAVLMTVLAALRSGVGLVTAFVPEPLVPAYAARVPEAMWVGCPLTPEGRLALEGLHLVRERIERATALAIGPGLGRERETMALVREILKVSALPAVLDADALQPELVRGAKGPLVLTPHAGEFQRIAAGATLETFARTSGTTVVLKGPVTQIASGETVYHSIFGGPVLARGGSGDLLAGIVGSMLAQAPGDPALAAARGVVWHGRAAEALARAQGQAAVRTTDVLDSLAEALRSE